MSRAAAPASTAPMSCRTGDVCWEIDPDWRDLLENGENDGLPIDRWLREGRAAAMKQGAGRTVYRVDLPERSFFVKHLRAGGFLQVVKDWLRRGACRREYEKARELDRRGVPAVAPIAVGERRKKAWLRDSFLVTEAVPQACSLDEFLAFRETQRPATRRFSVRRRLLKAAARLCARAHDAGVFHDDLHGGNILLRLDTCLADDDPQLLLVDLPGVQLSGPLDRRRTCDSLAMLYAGFLGRVSETDRLRFWRTYARERRLLPETDIRQLPAEIRTAALLHARRIADRRDKRAWADNRDFYRLTLAGGTAHAVRDLPRSLVEQMLRNPEALWRANIDRPVKFSFRSLVVEADLPLVGGVRRVAVKRLRQHSWIKTLIGKLRHGRAPRAWYLGHALLARGIPTARPLVVYQRRGARQGEGVLITEWISDALDVHLYLWDVAERDAAERRRRVRQTAESLGRIVGRLHDQGFRHRDLKGNNLIVRESADAVEPFLIDLDGLRQGRRLPPADAAKNLSRLAVSAEMHPWLSRSDRLRFLRAYLRQYDADRRLDWKFLWRQIAGHVDRALCDYRRRGKAIT